MANTETTEVMIDLAIVVKRECGCFAKFYFELEGKVGDRYADRDYDFCPAKHWESFQKDAEKQAQATADRLRKRLSGPTPDPERGERPK